LTRVREEKKMLGSINNRTNCDSVNPHKSRQISNPLAG